MPRSPRLAITVLEARDVPAVALDPSFGVGGAIIDTRAAAQYSTMFVQADGKAIVGFAPGSAARYNADGSADASFGTGGIATFDTDYRVVGVQPDGHVVLGSADTSKLARLNADGTRDSSFAGDGVAEVMPERDGNVVAQDTVGSGTTAMPTGHHSRFAVDGQGRIIAVEAFNEDSIEIERFNADGTTDATFGAVGTMTLRLDGVTSFQAVGVAVGADGSVGVLGSLNRSTDGQHDFIARVTATGVADTTFGSGGIALVDIGTAWGVAAMPDGGYVTTSYDYTGDVSNPVAWSLDRFDADSTPDAAFTNVPVPAAGRYRFGFVPQVAVESDGSVVVAGTADAGGRAGNDFAIARIGPDGKPDPNFNGGQTRLIDLGGDEWLASTSGLAALPDGRVLLAGTSNRGSGETVALALVNPEATQAAPVALTASSATPKLGDTVTLSVAVTMPGQSATGTVTFKDGPVALGTVTVVDSKATFTWKATKVGDHIFTASYASGSTRIAADPMTLTVGKGALTVKSLVASPVVPASGQWMKVRFDFTSNLSDPRDVVGTVTFKDNGTIIGTVPLRANQPAELSFRAPAPGQHTYTADYSGNASVVPASAAPLIVTIGPKPAAATQTELSTATRPASGQPIQLLAVVRAMNTARIDGGTVTFREAGPNGRVLGSAPVVKGDARFSFTPSNLAQRGSVTVVAHYDGTTTASASDSATLTLTPKVDTRLTLSLPPAVAGRPVTLTARLATTGTAAVAATGTVTFRDGSTVLGTATLSAAGIATLTVSGLTAGGHSLSAAYDGTIDYYSAVSPYTSVYVQKAAQVSLSVTGPLLVAYKPLTFKATVSGVGKPGGTVTFRDGSYFIGSAVLDASGKASLTLTKGLAKGRHSLTATYNGDTTFAPGNTSVAITLT
ncbi:MAG: Ig-like domain repeat protein [Gemmataceae bacterium]